jgi:hypothetical protein
MDKTTLQNERGSAPLTVPDPTDYRQELLVGIRRAYEWGDIDAAEVWQRCARLLGADGLARLLEGRRTA